MFPFFVKKKKSFTLFMAVLGLRCGAWASFVVASFVIEHRVWSVQASVVGALALELGLSSCGNRLSCPVSSGIFPNQGLNPCPLCWQAYS